ncbi:MAG TPA: glutamate racemase [Methylophilaceae bacterium]|nr:glutamate racemase [Methylophilaceae bacterium]
MSTSGKHYHSPIGVFDSGVGGISVLKHLRDALPNEDLLYCADSRFAPYGNKSPQAICDRAIYLAEFLMSQGAKALVIACNTATAAAVHMLRQRYSLPIIGMEPAVKPAAAATRSGVVGVLATSGTLKSAQFAALLESYGQNIQVVTQACHGLVECIERGDLASEETRQLLAQYLAPLLDAGADTIVLGCTHYPFVRPLIEQLTAGQVSLIDTGAAVARQVQKRLDEAGLLAAPPRQGGVRFWSNSDAPHASAVIARLWQGEQHSGEIEVLPLP